MVKSRAEICRDYGKRLKETDNEAYLRKERERRRKHYVPVTMLRLSEKSERRRKVRDNVRQYRVRKRQLNLNQNRNEDDNLDTSGYESIGLPAESHQNLIVAMHFKKKAAEPRKRQAKDLKQAKNTIAELRKQNLELSRKLKTEQRKRQRVLKKFETAPDTARRETENMMRTSQMTRPQREKVKKAIIFGNVIAHQLHKKKVESNKSEVHKLVAGQILKKYRCNKFLCKKVGLNNGTLRKYSTRESETQHKRLKK